MGMFEHIGSTDPKAERAAQAANRETLDQIQEEIGEETYRELIRKMAEDEPLSDQEVALVRKIRASYGSKDH